MAKKVVVTPPIPEYRDEEVNGPVEEWYRNSFFMIELWAEGVLKDNIIISELLAALSPDLQYRVNTELQRQKKQSKQLYLKEFKTALI